MKFIEKVILNFIVNSLLLVYANDSLKQCTPHIRSCCDLRTFPPKDAPNGMYKMNLGTFASLDVYCDMTTDGGGWIVIQRNRKNSKLNFNKNWKEYEDGFGDLNEDFWVGLKMMNVLTKSGQWEMRVDFRKTNNAWSYLHYNEFKVGDPGAEYPLTVAGYTGGSGDYFTTGNEPANNAKFSTYDNDNDVWNNNCAAHYGSGWWYYSCYDIHPNIQPPMSDYPTTVLFMEMKIRPKGCTIQ